MWDRMGTWLLYPSFQAASHPSGPISCCSSCVGAEPSAPLSGLPEGGCPRHRYHMDQGYFHIFILVTSGVLGFVLGCLTTVNIIHSFTKFGEKRAWKKKKKVRERIRKEAEEKARAKAEMEEKRKQEEKAGMEKDARDRVGSHVAAPQHIQADGEEKSPGEGIPEDPGFSDEDIAGTSPAHDEGDEPYFDEGNGSSNVEDGSREHEAETQKTGNAGKNGADDSKPAHLRKWPDKKRPKGQGRFFRKKEPETILQASPASYGLSERLLKRDNSWTDYNCTLDNQETSLHIQAARSRQDLSYQYLKKLKGQKNAGRC